MNKIFKYQIIFVVFCLSALLTACDDWTDTKGIDIIESDIEKDNPELYQKYLANLRAYRDTNHKYTYIWFDNMGGVPNSRGQRINAIPDSVDVVNLMNPDELSSYVIEDMESAQKDKGMKFVLSVSYTDLEKLYEQHLLQNPVVEGAEEGAGEETVDGFLAFAGDYVDGRLAIAEKYHYDGISVLFYGSKTTHMTEAQKEAYFARESAFMSKVSAWVAANPTRLFIFEGYPQNLSDKSILQAAEFIVVRTELLKYASALDFEVLLTVDEGVPTDRYLVTVNAKSFEDEKIGYFYNENNELSPCIPIAAGWVDTYNPRFTKIGIGILNAQNDYFNSGNSYQSIRDAIATMNPSPKI